MSEIKQKEKVWGLYLPESSGYTEEKIEQSAEYDIWKMIDNRGKQLFYLQHDAGKPWASKVSKDELIDLAYFLQYLVYHTRKFGVQFDREPNTFDYIQESASYKKWFEFWHIHFNTMPVEIYEEFIAAKKAGGDVSAFLPQIPWQEQLEEKQTKTI